jgi:hypothetical protein
MMPKTTLDNIDCETFPFPTVERLALQHKQLQVCLHTQPLSAYSITTQNSRSSATP